ncbi:hypothetical protein [Massilia sp. HP4]|uniref:hypothetical protein n=1 Tax=Massilia sp. HP4 TaxID=2562316 RepID=UPI001E4DF10F|nr:hypothetical protein [Massilia sp. HP4]
MTGLENPSTSPVAKAIVAAAFAGNLQAAVEKIAMNLRVGKIRLAAGPPRVQAAFSVIHSNGAVCVMEFMCLDIII